MSQSKRTKLWLKVIIIKIDLYDYNDTLAYILILDDWVRLSNCLNPDAISTLYFYDSYPVMTSRFT